MARGFNRAFAIMRQRSLIAVLLVIVGALSGCGESKPSLEAGISNEIEKRFSRPGHGQIEVVRVQGVVPTTVPPRSASGQGMISGRYMAFNARVVLNEPTYRIVKRRLLNHQENLYKVWVGEVTRPGFEGVLMGKVRVDDGEPGRIHLQNIIGVHGGQIGRFLSQLDGHIIEYIPTRVIRTGGPLAGQGGTVSEQEMRQLESRLTDTLADNGRIDRVYLD